MQTQSFREVFETHEGKVSDKWDFYLQTYGQLFAPVQHKPVNLLEIGIQNGGSLDIWAKYFASGTGFVGVDIDPACASLQFSDPRISTIIGDAKSPAIRDQIRDTTPRYDVVVDDGSHISSDVIANFLSLVPLLADEGIYVVEDMHCSYWKERGGELFAPYSAMAFFKALADVINQEHWSLDKPASALLQPFAEQVGGELPMADLLRVESITFLNSLIIIRKSAGGPSSLGQRRIAGTGDAIAEYADIPTSALARKPALATPEDYFWAWHDRPPVEELANALADAAKGAAELEEAKAMGQELVRQLTAATDRHLAALAEADAAKAHLESVQVVLAREIGQLVEQKEACEAHLAEEKETAAGLRDDHQQSVLENASLRAVNAAAELQLTELQQSTSWRLTRPLRTAKQSWQRLRRQPHA